MENRKATEAGQDVTMQKEDFAALWKTIWKIQCKLPPKTKAILPP